MSFPQISNLQQLDDVAILKGSQISSQFFFCLHLTIQWMHLAVALVTHIHTFGKAEWTRAALPHLWTPKFYQRSGFELFQVLVFK